MYDCLIYTEVKLGLLDNAMVVLGWYPLKKFLKLISALDKPETYYGVVGGLFNGNFGSDILIRNLLYNPQITDVVLCNITLADDQANYPCNQLYQKIRTSDDTDIAELFNTVNLITVNNEKDLLYTLIQLRSQSVEYPTKSTRRKVTKPLELSGSTLNQRPSQFIGQSITDNLDEAHITVLKRILYGGKDSATKPIRELLNLIVTVTDLPEYHDDLLDTCGELDQTYVQTFISGSNDGFNYGYGDRIRKYFGIDQLLEIVGKLKRKPDSLAATVVLWDTVKDLTEGDAPCLTQLWFRIIENTLYCTANFRSNDMFKAWKSNVRGIRATQIFVANALEIKIGSLTTVSNSAHIYQLDFPAVEKYLGEQSLFKKDFRSVVGNFTIVKRLDDIEVIHTDNDGELIQTYSQWKTAKNLLKKIVEENPTIEISHILYLAHELYTAEKCFRENTLYFQS